MELTSNITNNRIEYIKLSFFLNDKMVCTEVRPDSTLLELLRENFNLSSVKESCSEGDCGACTVAIGELTENTIKYKAYNSCIYPAPKIMGKHVVTVDGLSKNNNLNPIQDLLLKNHAVQCGYCTPGIIMSLFCLFFNNPNPSQEDIKNALEGNLCRCTGYLSIENAALELSKILSQNTFEQVIIPPYFKNIQNALKVFSRELKTELRPNNEERETIKYFIPQNLEQLYEIFEHINNPKLYKIVNGGTDVFVEMNVKRIFHKYFIDISKISELNFIKLEQDKLLIGAGVTLKNIYESDIVNTNLPILKEVISQMASEQIRNIATLSGNIANASPIADGAVALLALNSSITILSKQGQRTILLKDFYKGYKSTELKENEIIGWIEIPIKNELHSFIKSSKRVAVDIASVNSFISLSLEGEIIKDITIAFGGIAPYPILANQTMEYLFNKEFTEHNFKEAGKIAIKEFKPISDIRGSAEYRKLLVRNHLIKHFYKLKKE